MTVNDIYRSSFGSSPSLASAFSGYDSADDMYDSGMGAYTDPKKKLPWQEDGYVNPSAPSQSQNFADILKSGLAANYNFQGQDIRQQQGISNDIGSLANASYDPNNAMYKKIYNDEAQSNQQNLAATINEAMNQNRKAAQMGRVPLFNPERAGETAFRTMAGGLSASQDAARARAREIIGAGINAKKAAYDAAASASAAKQQNRQGKFLGGINIADALPILAGFL